MAWTASALSFALRGAPLPIVLFGSDRPLSDPRANGADNFRSGISFSLSERLPGVFVAWRNPGEPVAIHLGTRLLPADPHLDRFRSPLDAAYGLVSEGVFSRVPHPRNPTRSALAARSAPTWARSLRSLQATSLFEDRVLVLPPQPGLDHTPLLSGLDGWKAILQIAHHSGTAASERGKGSFLELARAAREADIPVFLGPARPGFHYSGRNALLDAGVKMAPNQTWPSLAVKIRHLLGEGHLELLGEDLAWELL
jgi:L-asparaginase